MYEQLRSILQKRLAEVRAAGLYKEERIIITPQGPQIRVRPGKEVLNFCANNYLGLSSHPKVIEAAHRALEERGYGLSSVRFICGTQDIHRELEERISDFLGTEDTILYSSCFDANGGLFETLLGPEDAVISDSLNHASIIDGIRLCKAERYRYQHNDMAALEGALVNAGNARVKLIATDGVFSMDGAIANLPAICDLAERHNAVVMVDDSHATGFLGARGRGTPEYHGVQEKVDVITSTLGKALGGASGGFTSGRKEIVDVLRQHSRPYLFSNTLSPVVVGTSLAVLDLLSEVDELRARLWRNTAYFRGEIARLGFDVKPGEHPIVPIMLSRFPNDAQLAQLMARDLLEEGIYVVGFSYPVVPKGEARIRVQISAAHEQEHLDRALEAFAKVGRRHGVIQ